MRDENRSRPEQRRLAPLRQIRHISRESHHDLIKPGNRNQSHRIVRRAVLEPPARADHTFKHTLDVLYIDPEPNLQFRSALSAITFGRVPPLSTPMLHVVVPKKLSSGHSHARRSCRMSSSFSMADSPASGY